MCQLQKKELLLQKNQLLEKELIIKNYDSSETNSIAALLPQHILCSSNQMHLPNLIREAYTTCSR